MRQMDALEETIRLARERLADEEFHIDGAAKETLLHDSIESAVSLVHFEDMLRRSREAYHTGSRFSSAKDGRWLGYVQGVLVAFAVFSLDEVKEINRQYA